jgi:hypothetical protein
LDAVATAAGELREPWWIIGSAAACLIGLHGHPADVDLLVGEEDAHRLLGLWKSEPQATLPSHLFRSTVFGRVSVAPLPIEVMAGLRVHGEPLVPRSRLPVPWRGKLLYVPDLGEQVAILRLFGREKDLRRADALRAFSARRV